MPLFTSSTALRIINSVAIVINQAVQLARVRIASANSPVQRMMAQRDDAARFVAEIHGRCHRRRFYATIGGVASI